MVASQNRLEAKKAILETKRDMQLYMHVYLKYSSKYKTKNRQSWRKNCVIHSYGGSVTIYLSVNPRPSRQEINDDLI